MSVFDDFRRGVRTGRAYAAGRSDSSAAGQDRGGADGFDREQPDDFGGDELAECKAVIAGLLQENASFKAALAQWGAAVAERDEYIGTLHAQQREMESIIAFPGVKNALVKPLHPDTGTGGDAAARTAIFQTLMAVCARLGIR